MGTEDDGGNAAATAAEMSRILVALNAYIAGGVSLYEPPIIQSISCLKLLSTNARIARTT